MDSRGYGEAQYPSDTTCDTRAGSLGKARQETLLDRLRREQSYLIANLAVLNGQIKILEEDPHFADKMNRFNQC